MKRFFYILFISVTVFFFFGFRGCAWLIDSIPVVINYHAARVSGSEIHQIAVGDAGKVFTQTGGLNEPWIESSGNPPKDLNYIRITSTMAVAVGDLGTVLCSTDWGLTWESRNIPSLINLHGFDFLDYGPGDVQVVVCGDDGVMYKSTNSGGGWNWTQISTITTENLKSIMAIGTDFFIVVGDSGTIIRTSDGGQNWENKSVQAVRDFNRIFNGMSISLIGYAWAVATNAYIMATTNYGSSWTVQYPLTFDTSMIHIYDIAFKNQNEGILVGQGGLINYTTNGGTTWLKELFFDTLTTHDIISLAVIDTNTATGIIRNLSFDAGGSSSLLAVSSEPLAVDENNNIIPSEYSLEQNFPNPFNPSTTIQFSIPEQSFVTLEIFNALGEKITTLVSKELNAGNHKYDWIVENIPSGIYLYKLKTPSFSESKKMTLLK